MQIQFQRIYNCRTGWHLSTFFLLLFFLLFFFFIHILRVICFSSLLSFFDLLVLRFLMSFLILSFLFVLFRLLFSPKVLTLLNLIYILWSSVSSNLLKEHHFTSYLLISIWIRFYYILFSTSSLSLSIFLLPPFAYLPFLRGTSLLYQPSSPFPFLHAFPISNIILFPSL